MRAGRPEPPRPVDPPAPRLAPGVELIGPYLDSGLSDPPYLIGRVGRINQVSRLLYVVTAAADGTRSFGQMAAVAAAELGRPLTADDIRFLVEEKLAPAGFLTLGDPSPGDATPGDPTRGDPAPPTTTTRPLPTAEGPPPAQDTRLFALRFRTGVVSAETMDAAARRVQALFHPVVVTAVLAAVVLLDAWLVGADAVLPAMRQMAATPAVALFVLAGSCLSGAFHELGHAAGCRYSGGRPGVAGVGLYLIWPVLYSNVTDAYRLDRRGRLRTDLGGIYFNAVFTVMVGTAWALTGWTPLVALAVMQHALVLHQFVPWLRLDGFYVVSDLTGVPDILTRVKPALLSLLPGRPMHPEVARLRPEARRILYAYLLSLVAFMALAAVPSLWLLPRMLTAGLGAVPSHLAALQAAAARWDTVLVAYEGVQVVMLILPAVGLALTAGTIVAQTVVTAVRLARRIRARWRSHGRRAAAAQPLRASAIRPRPVRRAPVRHWLDTLDLAVVEGTDFPAGGGVDWFVFGPGGDVALVGTADPGGVHESAARLGLAAAQLRTFDADRLDRLLLEGPPYTEVAARVARRKGLDWDEARFRARLDETLARGDFPLIVARPARFGSTLRVYPVAFGANRHKTEKMPRIGTSARKSYNKEHSGSGLPR